MIQQAMKVTKKTAPEVVEVALRAFPDYHGRKFRVKPFSGPMTLISGWDGGSKDEYRVVPLVSSARGSVDVPTNGTFPTQNGGRTCMLSDLPEGFALVRHTYFCGRDIGCTVFVNPANFNANVIQEGTVVQ